MTGFLGQLSDQINSQFSIGENSDQSLDSVIDGQNVKYGKLGDFASKFDQSSQRRYVEEGYLRKDPWNTNPKQMEILMQEPNATVLLKKRMFNSIAENFRPDFMDADEKLYFKAMKVLFQNKCRQISSLEKLSKIQKITSSVGSIDDQLVPIIITLSETINNGFASGADFFGAFSGSDPFKQSQDVGSFIKTVDRLKRVYAFNATNATTTWITDSTNLFQSQFGEGTGVIEITNFTSLSTSVTTNIQTPGNFSISISDPYESMLITEYDIERALSDATNSFYNHKSFQFGKDAVEQVINDNTNRLNQLRSTRGASPISFKVNPNTLLGKRVVAIFDRIGTELPFTYDSSGGNSINGFSIPGLGGAGQSVHVTPDYLRGGAVAGEDGLDTKRHPTIGPDDNIRALFPDSELGVFSKLVASIFQKIELDANSRNAFQTTNKLTNYARKKLRFNFSGKLIIQPMDQIHIYLGSKSRFDNKLLSGLNNMFTGNGILQNLNKTIVDFRNAADTLFNPTSVSIQAEKSTYVGPEFPTFLWSLIRTQFVNEKEGVHVFAGVVDRAQDLWQDGKFTIDVSGRDNSAYFEMGKVNFKPSVDSFNGIIYDPLTPFKTNFDTITSAAKDDTPELLDENKYLLGQKSLVKFKLGPTAGKPVTPDNYIQDRSIDPVTGRITRVFYAPDGLVYKWKEGLGVFVQFGSSLDINTFDKVGVPNVYNDPFAGQDVMNVISLLITGQPYNFATYWKATTNLYGFNKDPQSLQDSMYSFATALSQNLTKNNTLWGNFIPFKSLVVDEQSFALALQSQFRINQKNKELDIQLNKLKDLNSRAILLGADNIFSKNSSDKFADNFLSLQSELTVLTAQIDKNIQDLQKDDSSFFATAGSDTSFDYNNFLSASKISNDTSSPELRRALRRQTNSLTRRMSYNVRANEDKNLFIVDDYYDKDFDIIAYNSDLVKDGLSLYNNEFNSVKEKIMATADLLNLEVFCDTQGHIRVRPPQYNKMPSSIFYRMMYLKQAYGVQIFPQFLEDIFSDQSKALRQKIEILEDEIRLDAAVLGYFTDEDATKFILGNNLSSGQGDSFGFISNTDGAITDISGLLQAANPDQRDEASDQSIQLFTNIEQQINLKEVFSNTQKYSAIKDALAKQNLMQEGFFVNELDNSQDILDTTRVNTLISRIQTKSGQKIPKDYFIATNDAGIEGVELPAGTTIDIFKVTNDLSLKISERQKALKLFFNVIKNSAEFKSLDSRSDTGNSLLTPGIYGNKNIPEVYEHMIEDESYDDYGPGSGSRYIIKRAQIKSIQIAETPPDYTTVEVHGTLNNFDPEALPPGLKSFPLGGNGLVTALAIDYDMWRNYGFRQQSPITVPFLTDPNTQCAPYAAMILSRARKNILRGTVTISGNEYMQPGEVVFIEDRNMLFYVAAVRHSITIGGSFTTSLDLTFGHSPGEYIPTNLDVIGKMIFNNKDVGGFSIQRQSNSGNESNLGVIIKDPNTNSTFKLFSNGQENQTTNTYSAHNSQIINNLLYIVAARLNSNNTSSSPALAKIELRVYRDNNNDVSNDVLNLANQVRQQLINPDAGPKQSSLINQPFVNPPVNQDDVSVVTVNLDDEVDRRSPSQKALDMARNLAAANQSSDGSSLPDDNSDGGLPIITSGNRTQNDIIRVKLFSYIVDCWIKFENISTQSETNSGS